MANLFYPNLPLVILFLVLFLNNASTLAFGRHGDPRRTSSFRYARPLDYVTSSSESYSASRGRAILGADEEVVPKKSTTNLGPEKTYFATTTSSSSAPQNGKEGQFQAAAHAVPSGANPESNK